MAEWEVDLHTLYKKLQASYLLILYFWIWEWKIALPFQMHRERMGNLAQGLLEGIS